MAGYMLTKFCYKIILHNFHLNGRITWATKVKNLSHSLGFGCVSLSQEIGDVNIFIQEAKQRLLDIAQQE